MKILAIETSCDETGAAVIQDDKILSNVVASQAKLHSKFGGVVPEMAAREHIPLIIPIINEVLKYAKTKLAEIDAIAVTQGPGLMTSLMVGVDTARALAIALGKPLIPVNHLEAHIYANFVGKLGVKSQKSKVFPALILIVSGGHTLLVLMKGHGSLKIVGETLDDAAGEAFDKTAKLLGLDYPGGPALSKLAKEGNAQAFNLPRPMINSKDLNFSFSGLKTAVLYKIQELGIESASDEVAWRSISNSKTRLLRRPKASSQMRADLAASIQQAIVDVLIAKTEQAIKKYHPKTIMLGGGVAANELLRKHFKQLATTYNLQPTTPPLEYCTDNAAMIGLAAYYRNRHKKFQTSQNFGANPNLELV
ncbi:MAG: tRNA (adenosine(37)-N6)-threonylcarbamoyltransferase complex transferase subunit TsaD [Candidatus Doudnabacteria bacterium]|nr:tRNA (adenosine(37)-N6)-threonylcarbamoyltransferase complex transferase subunit TsaD [Candidatus Doudnabacteria bacterium]